MEKDIDFTKTNYDVSIIDQINIDPYINDLAKELLPELADVKKEMKELYIPRIDCKKAFVSMYLRNKDNKIVSAQFSPDANTREYKNMTFIEGINEKDCYKYVGDVIISDGQIIPHGYGHKITDSYISSGNFMYGRMNQPNCDNVIVNLKNNTTVHASILMGTILSYKK